MFTNENRRYRDERTFFTPQKLPALYAQSMYSMQWLGSVIMTDQTHPCFYVITAFFKHIDRFCTHSATSRFYAMATLNSAG